MCIATRGGGRDARWIPHSESQLRIQKKPTQETHNKLQTTKGSRQQPNIRMLSTQPCMAEFSGKVCENMEFPRWVAVSSLDLLSNYQHAAFREV